MGGCLSSKLLVTTTSRSLSFRNHPFHHYTSNSATTNSDHDDDDPSSASTPPPAPSHHPVPNNNNSHLLSLFRVSNRLQRPDAATSLGGGGGGGGGFDAAAAADTIIDFMGKGLYLDDHPPPHDQTTTSTTDDHAHTNASHHRLIRVISCGPSSPDHHQINDSAGTTSTELFLRKQLDRQVQFSPESNGMVVPVRSRSFHTVEEYDAIVMLEDDLSQSHNSQTLPQVPDHHQLLLSSKSWSNISREADDDDDDDDEPSNIGGEYSSITNIRDGSKNKQVKVRSVEESNSCKDAVLGEREEGEEEEGRSIFHQGREERGSKRKMMAKGMVGSLQVPVPPPLEFTTTVGLRQWLLGGGGGSDYVTPKFGSYNNIYVGGGDSAVTFGQPMGESEEDVDDAGGGKIIIDPELVAAFEECMQQLEIEEEKLIKQIEDEDEDHQF